METVHMMLVMAAILFLMYPVTNMFYCKTVEKASFGYAKCDNMLGALLCILIMMIMLVISGRIALPRGLQLAASPF